MSKILNRSLKLAGELVIARANQGGLIRVYSLDEEGHIVSAKFSGSFGAFTDLSGADGFAIGAVVIAETIASPNGVLINVGTPEAGVFVPMGGKQTVTGLPIRPQPTPTAKTVSATLTAAELLAGIVTINQGAGATSAQQLPTVSDLESYLDENSLINNDSFDISIMNISTVDAEDATVTTNTGWTLVGRMDFPAYSAAGSLNSSGILRLRRVSGSAWTAYRIA